MPEFAERLRDARLAKRQTMTQLAAAAGVSESSVRAYERGQREPLDRTLFALAEALDVEPLWLLGRQGAAV